MKLSEIVLMEIELEQLPVLVDILDRTVAKYGLRFKPLPHSVMRMVYDPSRKNINALDVYETIKKFLEIKHKKFDEFKKQKKEYVGRIQNSKTKLNIIVSINFHEKREIHDFKIVTLMVKNNFKYDNYSDDDITVI
jgi:hypothetical protein